jgi:hypothetical protein
VALLIGAVAPLDLRLLGVWPSVPLKPLWRVLSRTAAAGLFLAAACGLLLFAARASSYAAAPLFLAKMIVVALGGVNALGLHALGAGNRNASWMDTARPPARVRAAAGISAAAWLTVLVLGRLVGYF